MHQLSQSQLGRIRPKVTIALWLLGLSLTALAVSSFLPAGQAGEEVDRQSTPTNSAGQPKLMREGTRIVDRHAICRSSGEQLMIDVASDTEPLVALANLATQRILKAVMDDAGDEAWIINGQITEFKGHNYILLDRVTRQPKHNLGTTAQNSP